MLIIFDCDGVLVDSELLHAKAETEAFRETMQVTMDPLAYNKRFVGMPFDVIRQTIANENGKPLSDNTRARSIEIKDKLFDTELNPTNYIVDALKDLAGVPKCVASNGELQIVERSLKITGIYDQFAPHIFTAHMVQRGKPAPDLFLLAADTFEADPSECIVIEDSPAGIAAAQAAGMPVLGYVGGSHCGVDYKNRLFGANLIFNDMRDLPLLLAKITSEQS